MDLGIRIRELRTRRGLTLEELAKASGYSLDYLWKTEAGRQKPSWKFCDAIAKALGAIFVGTIIEIGGPDLLVREIEGRAIVEEIRGQNTKDVKLNERGRALACPSCGETYLEDDWHYCWQCGQALYNYCTSSQRHVNPPEAKRCVMCGVRTFWSLSPDELESLDESNENDSKGKTKVPTEAN